MKNKYLLIPFMVMIFTIVFISCASVGQHMPISSGETVIGTIQTTFVAHDSWLIKNDRFNTQAYIKLLEAAVLKYSGVIDIRDIVWVTGRTMGPGNTEVSAMAKVIMVKSDEE